MDRCLNHEVGKAGVRVIPDTWSAPNGSRAGAPWRRPCVIVALVRPRPELPRLAARNSSNTGPRKVLVWNGGIYDLGPYHHLDYSWHEALSANLPKVVLS